MDTKSTTKKLRIGLEERIDLLKKHYDVDPLIIMQIMKSIRELYERAHDDLTGLPGQRDLKRTLGHNIGLAKRYNQPLSLILMDIDYFKKFNDTYGHLAGDYVLRRVGRIASRTVRDVDLVARYGGEEFAIVLEHTNQRDAASLAERLRDNIEIHPFVIPAEAGNENQKIKVTASLGVVEYHMEDNVNRLIKKADDALYEAKREGRNRVYVNGSEGIVRYEGYPSETIK